MGNFRRTYGRLSWNLACWCILTTFRNDKISVSISSISALWWPKSLMTLRFLGMITRTHGRNGPKFGIWLNPLYTRGTQWLGESWGMSRFWSHGFWPLSVLLINRPTSHLVYTLVREAFKIKSGPVGLTRCCTWSWGKNVEGQGHTGVFGPRWSRGAAAVRSSNLLVLYLAKN